MITAAEALSLPSAQLSDEDIEKVNALEIEIENHIRTSMGWRGCELAVHETNANIIAEVNRRIKVAGFNAQWFAKQERHKFNHALNVVVGYTLALAPSDEAYKQVHAS